jgi:hypothetical protein
MIALRPSQAFADAYERMGLVDFSHDGFESWFEGVEKMRVTIV